MKSDQDNNEKLFFSRGMQPLENILNNERLKTLITHPVLATFINLKYWKFRKIFYLNFFFFMFFYMVPFFSFMILVTFEDFFQERFKEIDTPIQILLFFIFLFYIFFILLGIVISTVFLTLREIFQLFVLNNSFKEYFKKKANLLEVAIVVLSWTLLNIFFFSEDDEEELQLEIFPMISASIVILGENLGISNRKK